ncbi:Crp/Fnr family transcriptional regulator [bacterium]|nr:MAG: Crp/Fnr family transcriptional regulator [bacterium]
MKTLTEADNDYLCELDLPCFQQLSPAEIQTIQSGKTQLWFRKGENLTKQGAFASYVLFLVDGLAKQHVELDESKNFNTKIVEPGDFIGLSAIFTKTQYAYSTVALTDCKAFLIEKSVMSGLIKQNGDFGLRLFQKQCEQQTDLFEKLQSVLKKQMNGRLAEALLYLHSISNKGDSVFQLLSRKDIAEFAGMSTESTVKLLKSFEKDGWIQLSDKDIRLKAFEKLEFTSRMG